eukprot:GHVO01032890.1.p1 GENE.GHVO01032890.1~~GHVO01032890.1.p1  ORF type:complete len:236 (-),score=30.15 GHVO01032890.1:525-1232(-)
MFRIWSDMIVNNNNLEKVMGHDKSGRVFLQDRKTSDYQTWKIERLNAESISLKNVRMNKCLDIIEMNIEGRELSKGPIHLYNQVNVRNQQWYEDTDGIIRSMINGMAVHGLTDIHVDLYEPNLGRCLWTCRNGNTFYNIRYKKYLNGDLEAQDEPDAWEVIYTPKPFNLRNSDSGKVLDVWEGNQVAGTQIFLYKMELGGNLHQQQWYEDPYGFIRSKLNGLALDTKDGKLRAQV